MWLPLYAITTTTGRFARHKLILVPCVVAGSRETNVYMYSRDQRAIKKSKTNIYKEGDFMMRTTRRPEWGGPDTPKCSHNLVFWPKLCHLIWINNLSCTHLDEGRFDRSDEVNAQRGQQRKDTHTLCLHNNTTTVVLFITASPGGIVLNMCAHSSSETDTINSNLAFLSACFALTRAVRDGPAISGWSKAE